MPAVMMPLDTLVSWYKILLSYHISLSLSVAVCLYVFRSVFQSVYLDLKPEIWDPRYETWDLDLRSEIWIWDLNLRSETCDLDLDTVCRCVCLPVCLSVWLSICLSAWLSVFFSCLLSVFVFLSLFIGLSVSFYNSPPFCFAAFISLSNSLSTHKYWS